MNTRVSSNESTIVAEASTWFIEFRSGDASAEARARFDEWLRRSPQHIQAYLEVASAWSELPSADPKGRIDLAALIARARASTDDNVVPLSTVRTEQADRRQYREGRGRRAFKMAAAFATLAILVGVASWLGFYRAVTYSTGIGEQRTVRLEDGTTVELNALSTVKVRLASNVRNVELTEGQALFHVAKDPKRPFIVRSDDTTVRAVGTQFDVHRKLSGTVVTVLEGRVAVAEVKPMLVEPRIEVAPIYLSAGEQVTVTEKQTPHAKRADVATATAWLQKRLIFDETPLAEVASEFNRYNTRRLVVSDPELRDVAISGVYSTTDPDSLIGFLRAQPSIALSETETEIHLASRKGP
ncbi:FecR family protein [Steroidobacter sp.]|uniref:FecR family protein n=1 Tax=Steroidobacter sp. TaxID=1978227 RepID=UPI001A5EAE28|nr:FecR family protein [Steroidobacter sp.]MBL8268885.1 FecR family protein [Steroidobacter sp.]